MSKARFDTTNSAQADTRHLIALLNEALEIVDTLGRPEIGARLQHVIDSVTDLRRDVAA
ncbi:MAG TPA: hypothetical protein VM308_00265 [Sphingomicrobium sp.]|nr:hypothetical protein [Sphingomicrobium sp.]